MLSALTIDDRTGAPVDLFAIGRIVRATGLAGIGTVRAVTRPRPSNHGAIDQSRWTDGSLISLEGIALTLADMRTVAQPILETLDYGPALLKWTEAASGLALQKRVRISGEMTQAYDVAMPVVPWQAQLLAEDPRAYSQTLVTGAGVTLGNPAGGDVYPDVYPSTYTPSTGGTLAVNNTGNRPTPPVFRLYGGVTDADIILVGAGKQISLTGNIQNGDYLEIDVQNRSMKLNGTSNALSYLDPVNTTWFELPVGTSTIQTIAPAFDATARCDVLYRSAYT